jgi:cell division septum initiation protein DivIVA
MVFGGFMSKIFRPQIGDRETRYMERAMEIGGYSNATEFVNAAIMIAYQQLVDQQMQKAGQWESENWDRIKQKAQEMERLQLQQQDEIEVMPVKEVVRG